MAWHAREFRTVSQLKEAYRASTAERRIALKRNLVLLEEIGRLPGGGLNPGGGTNDCPGPLSVTIIDQVVTVCGGCPPYRVIVNGVLVTDVLGCCGSVTVTGTDGPRDVLVEVSDSGGGGGSGVVHPPQVAMPTFSPVSGSVVLATDPIAISCATAGATIFYTTDGSTPTRASTAYTGPFTVSTTTTVKAYAVAPGYLDSDTNTGLFRVNLVDASKWTGAWDFSTSPSPNIIAGKTADAIGINGGSISGGYATVQISGAIVASPGITPYVGLSSQWSMSFFVGSVQDYAYIRVPAGLDAIYFGLTYPYLIINGGYMAAYTAVFAPGESGHIIVIADGLAQQVRIYKNGVLAQTLNASFASSGSLGGVFIFQGTGAGSPTTITKMTEYHGIFSDAAIAALAGGAMPDANGNLL